MKALTVLTEILWSISKTLAYDIAATKDDESTHSVNELIFG